MCLRVYGNRGGRSKIRGNGPLRAWTNYVARQALGQGVAGLMGQFGVAAVFFSALAGARAYLGRRRDPNVALIQTW